MPYKCLTCVATEKPPGHRTGDVTCAALCLARGKLDLRKNVLVVLEQNRDHRAVMWFKDKRGDAAIYICTDEHYRATEGPLGQLAIFSYYFSPNVADVLVELDLATLEEDIRKWKGQPILSGDFNAKPMA